VEKTPPHWGKWIVRRANFIGFSTQKDFAAAIGRTRQHVTKLTSLHSPPPKMRTGLDQTLARVLKADRRIIFEYWKEVSPETIITNAHSPDGAVVSLREEIASYLGFFVTAEDLVEIRDYVLKRASIAMKQLESLRIGRSPDAPHESWKHGDKK
jgi:hypothetical protein